MDAPVFPPGPREEAKGDPRFQKFDVSLDRCTAASSDQIDKQDHDRDNQ